MMFENHKNQDNVWLVTVPMTRPTGRAVVPRADLRVAAAIGAAAAACVHHRAHPYRR